MNIIDEAYELLSRRILEDIDSKGFVSWALNVAKKGYDSESLWILAGLDNENSEVIEEYFWKTVHELNLEIENNIDEDTLNWYATYIAHKVVVDDIDLDEAIGIMYQICLFTDYDERYVPFYELKEDLDCLEYSDISPIFNSKITKENANSFIVKEFDLFLECKKLGITKGIYESAYCNDCNEVSKPKYKIKYQLKKPRKYSILVCCICESTNIDTFKTQVGKEKILKLKSNI